MISCAAAVRQLWDYLEQEVDAGDRQRMEEHLAFCRRCCGEVEFAEELRALLQSSARPYLPRDAETRLVGFIDSLEGDAT